MVETCAARDGLSDSRIRDVAPDPTGVVWVSTDAGLDRLRPALFAAIDPARRLPGSLSSTFFDRDGARWAGYTNPDSVYLLDDGLLRNGPTPLSMKELRSPRVISGAMLATSRRGGLWIKARAGNVFHM